jgi:hypothetical protein
MMVTYDRWDFTFDCQDASGLAEERISQRNDPQLKLLSSLFLHVITC